MAASRAVVVSGQKKGVSAWVWVLAAVPLAVFMLGLASAFAIYGVRKYIVKAKHPKTAETVVEPSVPSTGVLLAPVPPMSPLAALEGEAVDLSSVMGRARKLANQWQTDAALLGIEASTIVAGQIQTQDGGTARLTFGPSSFNVSQPRTGLFIVTYDKSGIKAAPAKGALTRELVEPMCAPEFIYRRVAGVGQAPVVSLRYGLDSRQRAVWLATPAADPKAKPLAFDPQNCQAAATPTRR